MDIGNIDEMNLQKSHTYPWGLRGRCWSSQTSSWRN